ncbi:hypothetical protein B6D60_01640 [candidate division KSB1 bacterium 4484_87]|nr:MAG: hypothetical protein B6D60_01640 [candidate division KSB1 bacterium 4484_87]
MISRLKLSFFFFLLFFSEILYGADKWTLWTGGTKLRGANIYQRRVYPELDGPTFLGSGKVGPPYSQQDINNLAAMGANYVNVSHPGLFTEQPPYVLDPDIQQNLDDLLDKIYQADMFAVICFRTGPGRSEFTFFWGEDGDWFDSSYYNDQVWQSQTAQDAWAQMWAYAAGRYKNHPAVVGYDLMVEPNANEVWFDLWDQDQFYQQYAGTLYDWNQLFPRITNAIRQVDSETPVLVGGMGYSSVDWLPYIVPSADNRTIYTVHQYAPHVYTHQEPPLDKTYPGFFDTDWNGTKENFNQAWLQNLFATIDDFCVQTDREVAINEFGAMRWEPGVADFMDDEMDLMEQRGMNYALWVWETSWQEYAREVDDFNFRHGPDPNHHSDVASSDFINAIKNHWAKNTVRPSTFWQTTFYVDQNASSANDANPGTENAPWLTLQHAVENVAPGDTIIVKTGTYAGARIENSGILASPIVLKAAEGENVLLNQAGPDNKHDSILEIETWEGAGVVSNWVIENFRIENGGRYGVDVRNAANITIRNNHVKNSSLTGIFTAFCDDVIIESNESENNGEHGIYYSNSGDRPIIRENVLHHNYSCGIHMNGDISMGGDGIISDGIVEKNIIYENGAGGGSGINMDGVTNTIVRNNLVYDNHASGISLYRIDGAVGSSNDQVLHNTVVVPSDGRWAMNIANDDCRNNKIFNNIFYSFHSWRGSIQIPEANLSGFECDYNILVDRLSTNGGNNTIDLSEWQDLGYDIHSQLASAGDLFVNFSQHDFHLRAGSPAVNSGKALLNVNDDLEGNLRPQGIAPDIGAYESSFAGNIFYVSTAGNDNNDGLSPQTAWRTIDHAISQIGAGDTIQVLTGNYGNFTVNKSGRNANPIVISGIGAEQVTVQGIEIGKNVQFVTITDMTVQGFSGWGVFVRGTNRYITFQRLKVFGGECGIHLTWGYSGQNPEDGSVSNITIENCTVANCTYTAIDGTPGPCDSLTFKDLEVYGAGISGQSFWGSDGIAIERGDYITVENCHVHDNGGDGIDLCSRDYSGQRQGILVRGNRVLRNRQNGIKLWAGGRMENNFLGGMGNTPVDIGAIEGTYEVINNTIACNMRDASYSVRNYAMVAAYPNDDTGVSAAIQLTMLNNIFAFNCSDQLGGPTGIYLGAGVSLVNEGYNCFFSRNDGEIQAEFVSGETWFTRQQITNGTWHSATGQGTGDFCLDPQFADCSNFDFRLQQASSCIDTGHPNSIYNDKDGSRNDLGGYGGPHGESYQYPGPSDNFSISGKITYFGGLFPISGVDLFLIEADTAKTITDSAGDFQFTQVTGGKNYLLVPDKSDSVSESTILSYDASVAARIALNLLPDTSVCQTLAADCDKNGDVQMFDASLIARYAVGFTNISGSFVGSWGFSPASRNFAPLTQNRQQENFAAVVIGDVDGSYPAAGNNGDGSATSDWISFKQNNDGNTEIDFLGSDTSEIYAFDIAVNFDDEYFSLLRVKKTEVSENFTLTVNDEVSGKLRAGAFHTESISTRTPLLSIELQPLKTTSSLEHIHIQKYYLNEVDVLTNSPTRVMEKKATRVSDFSLRQNYPNPFNQTTRISYFLSEQSRVKITVLDITGRTIRRLVDWTEPAGIHSVIWDGKNELGKVVASGIYWYRIETKNFSQTKKMVLLR